MKFKHINKGKGIIGFYDSIGNYHALRPGESCIIDMERPGYGVEVEKLEEKVNIKKMKEDN